MAEMAAILIIGVSWKVERGDGQASTLELDNTALRYQPFV
jgi:hypothetical protein